MKKMIRKILCLTLVFCLMVPVITMVSAGSAQKQGTNFVANNSATKSTYSGDIGSTSTAMLKTTVTYYYWSIVGGKIEAGTVESSAYKYANISGTSAYIIKYIVGSHYIGGSCVASLTVYP